MSLRTFVSAALMLAGIVPASAQATVSGQSPIELFGETLIFHLPDWMAGKPPAEALAASKSQRQENEFQFLMEMVPADQEIGEWTDLFAILAQRGEVSVADELDTIERTYAGGCDPARTLIVRSDRIDHPPTDGNGFATVFCGAYAADSSKGEIGVFRIVRQGDVTARIYREWKGDAFALTDRDAFPVPMETLQAANARMLATGFAPR